MISRTYARRGLREPPHQEINLFIVRCHLRKCSGAKLHPLHERTSREYLAKPAGIILPPASFAKSNQPLGPALARPQSANARQLQLTSGPPRILSSRVPSSK